MRRDGNIVRYTSDELREMRARGEDETDRERVRGLTDAEVEDSIDREEEGVPIWGDAIVGLPSPKRQITLRIDGDIIDEFKAQGPRYQSRINNVLRAYVNALRLQNQGKQVRKAS